VEAEVARVVVLVSDLMLSSRVTTSLSASGHEVSTAAVADASSLQGAELVVADLDAVGPAELADSPAPVIGFYQHTDVDTKRLADEAGLAFAVPRSRMVRELPELAERALSGR
jgi:hypothetical protein